MWSTTARPLSRDVIAAHIAGDGRCSAINIERNLGPLGAFFDVLPSLHGDFVVIVDADDTCFRISSQPTSKSTSP